MSLVASFAPSLRSGANDATRATNKLYALQKSCDCPSNKPVDIDSGLVNGQPFDSRLPCANSKPVLNFSKAVFFYLFVPGRAGDEMKESSGCEQRFLSSLTEKKEQGTSVSQGMYM